MAVEQESRGRTAGAFAVVVASDAEDHAEKALADLNSHQVPGAERGTWTALRADFVQGRDVLLEARGVLVDRDAAAYPATLSRLEEASKRLEAAMERTA